MIRSTLYCFSLRPRAFGDIAMPRASWLQAHEQWLMGFMSMKDGEAWLQGYKTSGGCARWRRLSGGSPSSRKNFGCGAHIDCPVKARVILVNGVSHLQRVQVQVDASAEPTTEPLLFDRINAALTVQQKDDMKAARKYGATSGDIMKEHQVRPNADYMRFASMITRLNALEHACDARKCTRMREQWLMPAVPRPAPMLHVFGCS